MIQMHGTAMGQAPMGQAPKTAAMLPMTPGRRIALLIGVPLCLLVTAFTAFNLVAKVGRGTIGVNYQLPAGASRVSVTTSGGNVLLRQAGSGAGTVTGTGVYSLVHPHVTHSNAGGVAYFGYQCAFQFGDCGLNATVTVPLGKAVFLSTGGGNVTAVGTAGDVTLSTGGGDVSASQLGGANLSLDTGGGNIQATGVTAVKVTADTGGGDVTITFTSVPRDVEVTTGGGDITIIVPAGATPYHVTASTGGGDVTSIPDDSTAPNVITATSGGGDITIRKAS